MATDCSFPGGEGYLKCLIESRQIHFPNASSVSAGDGIEGRTAATLVGARYGDVRAETALDDSRASA